MQSVRIALLGATSHIAKGLIDCWLKRPECELSLYARSPERVREFIGHLGAACEKIYPISEFGRMPYDVVVNCVGFGSPQRLKNNLHDVFRLTSSIDDMVLDYLACHVEALYVNLSSGAAYGSHFSQPVDQQTFSRFDINNLSPEEFYGISKLHSEARHRALMQYNVVDLRIFGYFSKFIDLEDTFLMSEILTCLRDKRKFITGPVDIRRDFIHPQDLSSLVDLCIGHCPLNAAFDVYSRREVGKFELLDFFEQAYGLKYEIDDLFQPAAVTGQKTCYYSRSLKAQGLGYEPIYTSLECVEAESSAILLQLGLV